MSDPTPKAVAEYLAEQIAGDYYSPTVRGPAEETFIEGTVDLVEVAKALAREFLVLSRADARTEYGVQEYLHGRLSLLTERATSRDSALATAKARHYDDDHKGRPRTRAVERLAPEPLPWAVIEEPTR